MDHINALTELQKSIGYVPGFISPVAVLGLAGECGEVLDELVPSADLSSLDTNGALTVNSTYTIASERIHQFIKSARQVDDLKKSVRGSALVAERLSYCAEDDDALDEELADVLYYLNALAIGRGLTLNDLARTSHAKVLRKRATIGPEQTGGN